MRIKQACVAPSLNFFKDNFLKKFGLNEYYDIYEPTIFFGAYLNSNLINQHQGIKIILPATPDDYPNISNYKNTFFICSDNYNLPEGIPRKSITPEIKDYSLFTPNILGDKIYFYSGFKNGWDKNLPLINEIQKQIDYEIITTSHQNLKDYYNISDLKSQFYDKCFLNLNFTGNGLSTVIELGLMGRKTIFKPNNSNNIQRIEFPNFIYYNTLEDIFEIIKNESKKIGSIQPPINAHNVGDEWLNLNYWIE
tara:strand:+ start:200 stop:952 length:753 start_codon:yes stop_codon:yes gene_type:complete